MLDLKPRLRKRAEENSRKSKSLEKFHKESVKNESQTFETRRNKTQKERDELIETYGGAEKHYPTMSIDSLSRIAKIEEFVMV